MGNIADYYQAQDEMRLEDQGISPYAKHQANDLKPSDPKSITISPSLKLQVIAYKYYQHMPWEPKAGDLYTIVRNDSEVFEIIDITDTEVFIKTRTNQQNKPTAFPRDGFTSKDFGEYRVFIHPMLHDKLTTLTDLAKSDPEASTNPLESAETTPHKDDSQLDEIILSVIQDWNEAMRAW